MRRVILESPFAGDEATNLAYAKRCLLDCLRRGEAPIASHLTYTQVLDDKVPADRELGMTAGHAWLSVAEAMVCYTDLGISKGMQRGIELATAAGVSVEYRKLS